MTIQSDSSILAFTVIPSDARTAVVRVTSTHGDAEIGTIQWDLRWRQYALTPAPGAKLTHRVLSDIAKVLIGMMDAWALERGREPRGDNPKFNQGLQTPAASAKRRKKRETSVPWK